MLIWTNLDSFAITYLGRSLQKFYFRIVVVLNSLQKQKSLEPVFWLYFLQIFLIFFFFCNMT